MAQNDKIDAPTLTDTMIDAALKVGWISAYQGEFHGVDDEDDAIMRTKIEELWNAMMSAHSSNAH